MSTKILAEKTGWISIIEVHRFTKSYMSFRFAMEPKDYKKFNAERGRTWELFDNVEEATRWIKE